MYKSKVNSDNMQKPDIKYIVKPECGIVVCIVKGAVDSRGVAKCHPDDKFNEKLGKEVARKRAIINYKKKWIGYWKEELAALNSRETKIKEDKKFAENKIKKLEISIGKICTEIDNSIEFYQ